MKKEFQAYQVIEAMGYQGEDKFDITDKMPESPQIYQVGWAHRPGNLASAEASAVSIVEEISRKFHQGTFDGFGSQDSGNGIGSVLASAPVDTTAQRNVLKYLLEQGRIETATDYQAARLYGSNVTTNASGDTDANVTVAAADGDDDATDLAQESGSAPSVREGYFLFVEDLAARR